MVKYKYSEHQKNALASSSFEYIQDKAVENECFGEH